MNEQPQATCPACGHDTSDHRLEANLTQGCYADCECDRIGGTYCPCSLTPADIALLTSPTRAEDAEIVRIVREPTCNETNEIGSGVWLSIGGCPDDGHYDECEYGRVCCAAILALAAKKGGSDGN